MLSAGKRLDTVKEIHLPGGQLLFFFGKAEWTALHPPTG